MEQKNETRGGRVHRTAASTDGEGGGAPRRGLNAGVRLEIRPSDIPKKKCCQKNTFFPHASMIQLSCHVSIVHSVSSNTVQRLQHPQSRPTLGSEDTRELAAYFTAAFQETYTHTPWVTTFNNTPDTRHSAAKKGVAMHCLKKVIKARPNRPDLFKKF